MQFWRPCLLSNGIRTKKIISPSDYSHSSVKYVYIRASLFESVTLGNLTFRLFPRVSTCISMRALLLSYRFETLIYQKQKPPHDYVGRNMGDIKHEQRKKFLQKRRKLWHFTPGSWMPYVSVVCVRTIHKCSMGFTPLFVHNWRRKNCVFEFDPGWSPPEFFVDAAVIDVWCEFPWHIVWNPAVCKRLQTRVLCL